jgi:hypothetical protein
LITKKEFSILVTLWGWEVKLDPQCRMMLGNDFLTDEELDMKRGTVVEEGAGTELGLRVVLPLRDRPASHSVSSTQAQRSTKETVPSTTHSDPGENRLDCTKPTTVFPVAGPLLEALSACPIPQETNVLHPGRPPDPSLPTPILTYFCPSISSIAF